MGHRLVSAFRNLRQRLGTNHRRPPRTAVRKRVGQRQQDLLYLTLGEIGRIERTLFMLDWMESPQLRMECQAGLNKGEA